MLGSKVAWAAEGYKYSPHRVTAKRRHYVDTEDSFLVSNGNTDSSVTSPTGPASARRVKSASHIGRNFPKKPQSPFVNARRVRSAGPATSIQRQTSARRVQRNNYVWGVDGNDNDGRVEVEEYYGNSQKEDYARRVQTAQSVPSTYLRTSKRPFSAQPRIGTRPGSSRRVSSARSARSTVNHSHQTVKLISSDGFLLSETEYLYQKAYQAGPDHRYFDRHSRCHGHTHVHQQLLMARPRKACQAMPARCPTRHRAGCHSPSDSEDDIEDMEVYTAREVQYMRSMRPRTAPVTRRDFQSLPRQNNVLRGTTPHFCSFVSKIQLHRRESQPTEVYIGDHDATDNLRGSRDLTDDVTAGAANQKLGGLDDGMEARPTSPMSSDRGGSDRNNGDEEDEDEGPAATIGVEIIQRPFKEDVSVPSAGPLPVPPDAPEPAPPEKKDPPSAPAPHPVPRPPPPATIQPKPKRPEPEDDASRRRACVTKKERKGPPKRPTGRREDAPPKEPEGHVTGTEDSGKEEEQKDNTEESPRDKVVLSAPDLPEYRPKKSKQKGLPPRAAHNKRAAMATKQEQPKTDEKSDDGKQSGKQYEFPSDLANGDDAHIKQQKPKLQPWAQGRLALSQQACRFELPMDMRVLEKLSPQDYLRQYCVFSSRRQSLYQKVFMKYKDKSGHITIKDLNKALTDVLVNTISADQVKQMCDLVQLDPAGTVDSKLFGGIAALSERILYPDHLTEDTTDIADHKKEKIESADFCALEWKFKGVAVNPQIRRILEAL